MEQKMFILDIKLHFTCGGSNGTKLLFQNTLTRVSDIIMSRYTMCSALKTVTISHNQEIKEGNHSISFFLITKLCVSVKQIKD